MCNASRKILRVLEENKPPPNIDFNDDFFDLESPVVLSVPLLKDEAEAMIHLAQKLTIVEAETFIKNKKLLKRQSLECDLLEMHCTGGGQISISLGDMVVLVLVDLLMA